MPTVHDVLTRKGSDVVCVGLDATVLDSARLMMHGRIGGVVVLDSEQRVVGILTERDVLVRVVAEHRDPATTMVSAVMTPEPFTVSSLTKLDACGALMTQQRVRHVPVMDDCVLCGIVTPGDLLAFRLVEQEVVIENLQAYVFDTRCT